MVAGTSLSARNPRHDRCAPNGKTACLECGDVAFDRADGHPKPIGELLPGATARARPTQRLGQGLKTLGSFHKKQISDMNSDMQLSRVQTKMKS